MFVYIHIFRIYTSFTKASLNIILLVRINLLRLRVTKAYRSNIRGKTLHRQA